jgi:hypothetical protein
VVQDAVAGYRLIKLVAAMPTSTVHAIDTIVPEMTILSIFGSLTRETNSTCSRAPFFGSMARRVIRSPRRLRQPVSAGAHWYNWRVCETARRHSEKIGKVYAGRNGIIGALTEDLIDTSVESDAAIAALKHTPGAAFGSCRYKLRSIHEHRAPYERLIEVFHAHDIGFFLYNGGGDSQDTAYKVSQVGAGVAHPLACVGIPKAVDNDVPITDCSPGFG